MASVLALTDVCKSYFVGAQELQILKNVSLDVQTGEFVAIMGASGSGKSTLLHLMGALDRPTSGSIAIGPYDLSSLDDPGLSRLRNKTIGFVFQNFFLLNYYTALENVCLPLVYAGRTHQDEHRAQAILQQLGMKDRLHHRPNELSGGERQRVAIARALINNPMIIFADEPTGSLDTKNGESIMEILGEINRSGTTIVMITHDPGVAKRAGRILHMSDGAFL